MKKIFFFTAIIFLMLSSCQKEGMSLEKDRTSVESQLQLLARNQPLIVLPTANSDRVVVPFHSSFDESVDGVQLVNFCTKEQMTLYGTIHYVSHGFDDGPHEGTDLKTTFHYNLPGTVRAIGESGREYSVTGTLNAQEGDFSVDEFTYKYVNKYRFFTKGGGSNFFYELTHYFKVDAAGNWTVIREEAERSYCR